MILHCFFTRGPAALISALAVVGICLRVVALVRRRACTQTDEYYESQ